MLARSYKAESAYLASGGGDFSGIAATTPRLALVAVSEFEKISLELRPSYWDTAALLAALNR